MNSELNEKIIDLSLSDSDFNDFKEWLQYYTALENGADIIFTRNKKGYKNFKLPLLTVK